MVAAWACLRAIPTPLLLSFSDAITYDEGFRSLLWIDARARDVEMERIERTLQQLHIGLDGAKTYALTYVALLSPVQCLPHDILLLMFEDVCTPEVHRRYHPPGICLRLGVIWKRWRAIALDSPSLWSTLCIPYGHELGTAMCRDDLEN
ncbi:hypothetical protein IW261DRAFT_1570954 [Armillaria novae-zelandiae]|uniref:F-box domain-containing protein n=1 Tax=Armillaria novae-zelandiae TaxID=153914 RepID=A0AA39TWZ0_9AGAR|nr:hypothetical protein IW261DRAFT_1570954 [Armillaria novae-zelandiae]